MLLHRYRDIGYIMSMDLDTGMQLIKKAQEQERDKRIWLQWAIQLPVMAIGDKATSYEEYRDRVTGAGIDMRPTNDILEELDELEKTTRKEEQKNGNGNI